MLEKQLITLDEHSFLVYFPQFFDKQSADNYLERLTESIAWRTYSIKIFGKTYESPRLTAWYGEYNAIYSYSGLTLTPLPWNNELLCIKQAIENQLHLEFNSCLLNLYRTGQDSMGWHADDEPELGPQPQIVSVSFGAQRKFVLRRKSARRSKFIIELGNGSVLLMGGACQERWEHALPKSAQIFCPRINLTFRNIIKRSDGLLGISFLLFIFA